MKCHNTFQRGPIGEQFSEIPPKLSRRLLQYLSTCRALVKNSYLISHLHGASIEQGVRYKYDADCKAGDPNTLHGAEQPQSTSQQISGAKTGPGGQVRFPQKPRTTALNAPPARLSTLALSQVSSETFSPKSRPCKMCFIASATGPKD